MDRRVWKIHVNEPPSSGGKGPVDAKLGGGSLIGISRYCRSIPRFCHRSKAVVGKRKDRDRQILNSKDTQGTSFAQTKRVLQTQVRQTHRFVIIHTAPYMNLVYTIQFNLCPHFSIALRIFDTFSTYLSISTKCLY